MKYMDCILQIARRFKAIEPAKFYTRKQLSRCGVAFAKLPCSMWASLVDVDISGLGQMNEVSKNVKKTMPETQRKLLQQQIVPGIGSNKHEDAMYDDKKIRVSVSYWNEAETSLKTHNLALTLPQKLCNMITHERLCHCVKHFDWVSIWNRNLLQCNRSSEQKSCCYIPFCNQFLFPYDQAVNIYIYIILYVCIYILS